MDIQYLLFLQNLREATGGFLTAFFSVITNIAVDYYIILPAFIIFWCVDKKKGLRMLATWGTALGLNAFMKSMFCIYRPWIRDSRVQPVQEVLKGATGYSFPSGHSSSSAGFYGGLFMAYRKCKGICIFAVVMVLLTMFSRNYVGVHTPQDVVVGALLGVIAALVINFCIKVLEQHPERDWMFWAGATILVGLLLMYIYLKSYPMDYVDGKLLVDPAKMTIDGFKDPGRFYGIVTGWFLERRFIHFSTEGTNEQKVTRALVGSLLYVFVWTAVCDPIGKAVGFGPIHFVLQAGCQILFMTVYPMVFTKLQKLNS